jgi:2-aminoethylphosphonate-pyruvate transaminase
MTSGEVKLAGAQEDMNHRDPRFKDLLVEVKEGLRTLSNGMHPTLLGGSGTAAMEAMVSSLLPQQGKILLLCDGYYSARMRTLLEVHEIPHDALSFPWLEGWDFQKIEDHLASGKYSTLVCTHHETTTGRLNDLNLLITVTKGLPIYVDAMSSLGADPIPFDGLECVVASANKCLHGLPGVSFVLTRNQIQPEDKPRTYYLNLSLYQGDSPPLTPPVPTLLSFQVALREFFAQGGQEARETLYRTRAQKVAKRFAKLGLQMPIPASQRSCTLTMTSIPPGFTWSSWFEWNWSKGYAVYGCKGQLANSYWQLGHMGEFPDSTLDDYLALLERDL